MKIIVWKNGDYKFVPANSTWEYENDPDWLVTIDPTEEELPIEARVTADGNLSVDKQEALGAMMNCASQMIRERK